MAIRKKTKRLLMIVCKYASDKPRGEPVLGFNTVASAEAYKKSSKCAGSSIICTWEDRGKGEEYDYCVSGYTVKKCEVV